MNYTERHAQYSILTPTPEIQGVPPTSLVIRDLCLPGISVTNDAEFVVRQLWTRGLLPDGRRLFYYDSEGYLDELLRDRGKFRGFKPGPGRTVQR